MTDDRQVEGDGGDGRPGTGRRCRWATGRYGYVPDATYFGLDTFQYTVDDNSGQYRTRRRFA